MKKIFLFICILSIKCVVSFSQTPDWSTTVAAIVYNHCSVCHHTGAIAPFPLMSYDDAVLNAFTIQTQVNAKKMPPWPADPNYSHFKDEKELSDGDITAINDWVNGGVPLGDTTLAPAPPVFTNGVFIANPDDTVDLPIYHIQSNLDVHRAFVVHSNYTESKYLNEVEFIPGNRHVVHHCQMFQDSSHLSWQHDSLTAEPGFAGYVSASPYCKLFAAYVPGLDYFALPPHMGMKIPAGADYVAAMHYAPGSLGQVDSSKIHLKFCPMPDPLLRVVAVDGLCNWVPPSMMDGPLFIPANTVKTFHEKSDSFTTEQSLICLAPHCHLIGKSWLVFMVTAPGDTTHLLSIPDWNFNWQFNYVLTKVMKIPVNAQIFATATFDNTSNNPNNPNNPPIDISEGNNTNDEMMAVHFWLMDYQAGDENIILDSAFYLAESNVFNADALPVKVFPNPANESVYFSTFLPEHEVLWMLTDVRGTVVKSVSEKNIPKGAYVKQVDVSNLPNGIYYLSIQSGAEKVVRSVAVVK